MSNDDYILCVWTDLEVLLNPLYIHWWSVSWCGSGLKMIILNGHYPYLLLTEIRTQPSVGLLFISLYCGCLDKKPIWYTSSTVQLSTHKRYYISIWHYVSPKPDTYFHYKTPIGLQCLQLAGWLTKKTQTNNLWRRNDLIALKSRSTLIKSMDWKLTS